MTTTDEIEWLTMDAEGNIDLAEEHKAMVAELREDAKTDKVLRKYVSALEQEAIAALPDASLTGDTLAIALIDSVPDSDNRDKQSEKVLQLMEHLEVLGRDETARAALGSYLDKLCQRAIGNGVRLDDTEYARHCKSNLFDTD